MNINPNHWDAKMSFKYPQIGRGNVITGFYLGHIISDMDVDNLLRIARTMQMGLGDVSVFLEADKVQVEEPYSLSTHPIKLPTHYGTISQFPDFGTNDGQTTILVE